MNSISWSDPAVDDLLELLTYFSAQQEPETGKKLVARIYKAAEILQTFPHAGKKGLVVDIRELVLPNLPYFLVYSIQRERIDILRVMHTAKLWEGQLAK